MAKKKTDDAPLRPSGAGGSSSGDTNEKGSSADHGDDGVKAAPQSKATSGGTAATKSPQNTATRQQEEDDIIAALTADLGSVSIATPTPPRLDEIEIEIDAPEAIKRIAAMLSSNKYKNIVILTGAGVSCNAGIPDFRTPGTGLYDNLQKYNLPFPEAVFDVGFYRRNPAPFVRLASELWPGLKHSPTMTHSFIALLDKKGLLLRCYTQNIDCLDVLAGVSEDKMIECHGHFRTASCTNCGRSFDSEECKQTIVQEKRAPKCRLCNGGLVKPDIVFFGEELPSVYHRNVKKDTKKADLLIVMGTSLMVGPVNSIPDMVRKDCKRVLFNRELVGSFKRKNGPNTRRRSHDTSAQRDIFQNGDCDESIGMLCDLLGWGDELRKMNASTRLG